MTTASDRIIVALDVETAQEARSIVDELKGRVGAFKIGLQLFTSEGAGFVEELIGRDVRIFLDLKFHDIPNTVAKASVEAARLGVWMFNMHASGGGEMMRAASASVGEFCVREGIEKPLMIGVTVLTSSDVDTLVETGVAPDIDAQVARLARLASESGLDGVVASSREVGLIREAVGDGEFTVVTPGIRPAASSLDDQKRVMGPADAVRAGSDYLVIGRPITGAHDKASSVSAIVSEIDGI